MSEQTDAEVIQSARRHEASLHVAALTEQADVANRNGVAYILVNREIAIAMAALLKALASPVDLAFLHCGPLYHVLIVGAATCVCGRQRALKPTTDAIVTGQSGEQQ